MSFPHLQFMAQSIPNSNCYSARKRHTAKHRGSNLNVPYPHL